jgi:hypothetical protein
LVGAGRVADVVVAVVVGIGGALNHTEASTVVGEEGAGTGLSAGASVVVSVPGGEADVEAAVGGVVYVEV